MQKRTNLAKNKIVKLEVGYVNEVNWVVMAVEYIIRPFAYRYLFSILSFFDNWS